MAMFFASVSFAGAGSSNFCVGGCINPDGKCCTWCPNAEVCQKMGKCQKIGADGCYTCGTCEEECPAPKCLNEEGVCCDSCPRVCPEGQCLINVDGCYQCGECPRPLPDDDADDDDDVWSAGAAAADGTWMTVP